jgi:hypothetical protein
MLCLGTATLDAAAPETGARDEAADSSSSESAFARTNEAAEPATVEAEAHPSKRPMNALKQLELDLRKALKIFRTETPGMPTPQMPVVVQPQRTRPPKDEKDWIFQDPKEIGRTPSDRDLYNLPQTPEELRQKKLSPMEKYFESYDRQRTAGMKAAGPTEEDLFGTSRLTSRKRDDQDPKQRDEKAEEARQKELSLRRMLGLGDDRAAQFNADTRSSMSDVFGLKRNAEESLTRKTLREEYREMWGLGEVNQPAVRSDAPVPGASGQFGLPGALSGNQSEPRLPGGVSSTLGTYLPSSRPNNSYDSLSGVNPVLRPDMQEMNRRSLNAWNPAASQAPAAVPAPRATSRPTAPMQTPQRPF